MKALVVRPGWARGGAALDVDAVIATDRGAPGTAGRGPYRGRGRVSGGALLGVGEGPEAPCCPFMIDTQELSESFLQ